MGHIRIGTLPATRRWKDVVGLVAEGAEVSRVAEATTHAWQLAFDKVRNDAGFRKGSFGRARATGPGPALTCRPSLPTTNRRGLASEIGTCARRRRPRRGYFRRCAD